MDDHSAPRPGEAEGACTGGPSGDPGGNPACDGDGDGCTRRRVLNAFLASGAVATGGSVLYPLARFLLPPIEVEASVASVVAGKVDEFPLNSGKIFKMGSKAGLLVHLPDGTFRAFSAICTHLSCKVKFRPKTSDIWCACHNGIYDLHGKNVAGPPPRPLEEFTAHVRGDEVVVSRGGS